VTNWRDFGDVSYERWQETILDAGGPGKLAGSAAWEAAKPHSALALAMLKAESSYGTDFNLNRPENNNPLNLRPPLKSDGTRVPGDYMKFDALEYGIAAWHKRITDSTYGGGIYARTQSLEDLVHVYAPGSDNNDEAAYVATIERLFDQWGVTPKETPVADLVYGKVPHPPFLDRPIQKPEGAGQNNLGQRTVKGVVWHRILGTLWGTDSYFRGPVQALTDYGVGVQATDGDAHDGEILRWNNPLGHQSGWASGPVSAPYGDGAAFVDKYGIDAVNRDQVSIEISGNYDTPLSEKARQSIVGLTAYWADQAKIPWHEFPNIPGDGFSFVRWHQEYTIGTGKVCPGPQVMGETSALIQRVAGVLKQYQAGGTVPKPPVYAPADLPEWFADALKERHPTDNKDGDVAYKALRRNFVATANTRRLSKPDGKEGKNSGPKVKVREKVFGEYQTSTGFVLTTDGHFVSASKLSPRVTFRT